MITENVKNLFKFINYLHSKTKYFVDKRPLIESLLELHKKRNLLKPNKNYKDRIEYNKLQKELGERFDIAKKETINPILDKVSEFNIAATIEPILNLNAQGDLFELQRNFTDADLKEIFKAKRKYLNFRTTTNCDFLLQTFFHDLDRDLKEFFDYFKDVEGNEFAQLDAKTAKASNLEDIKALLLTGKAITINLDKDLTKFNIVPYFAETHESIDSDFKTEYRRVQQMGNTSITLLRNFEKDNPFMDAFQKEFAEASLFADVTKYWRLFYNDKQLNEGFQEMDKMIAPKKGAGKNIMADFIPRTQFEDHLNELENEFFDLVYDGKAPKSCYTHNIQETNIYKQFKAIEDTFNRFKEMKNFDPSPNSLLNQAEQFGQGIILEIQKIDYKPIREKIIEVIINDAENIHYYLPKIVDNITNSQSVNFDEKAFSENYAKAKMYLNNYLSKYQNEQDKIEALSPQQIETKTELGTPKTFEELFYDADFISPCIDILKNVEPPLIDTECNYIGKLKGAFCVWIDEMQRQGIVKHFSDRKIFASLLPQKIKRFSIDESMFGKHQSKAENQYRTDIKTLLSQIKLSQNSQKGKLGK